MNGKQVSLFLGDCLHKMQLIPDGYVDLVLCDLPYGTTKCKWDSIIPLDVLWAQYKRVLKPTGSVVLFADQPFTSVLICSNLDWFKYEWVWVKNRTTGFLLANYRPMKKTEDIIVFSPLGAAGASRETGNMIYNPQGLIEKNIKKKNSGARIGKMLNQLHHLGPNNKLLSNVEYEQKWTNYPDEILEFGIEYDTEHPTQKPVPLMEYLVKTYSHPGQTVLDNTMGSGSTGVACMNTDRNFIGIEKEVKYFDLARNRMEKLLDEKQYLMNIWSE